jgi:hypothetical protein
MYARGYYSRPPGSLELSVRRVALLLVVAAASATIAFFAGRSLGTNSSTPSSLAGARAADRKEVLSTRLRPVPAIAGLRIPKPPPAPTATTPTTNSTPTSPATPAPQPSAPAPQATPAPAPAPAPSGGSFDDSG